MSFPLLPNYTMASRYRIVRELGQGATSIVYLAHDLKHQRDVALKVLRPELSQAVGATRFLKEIEIAARLTHPHVVPLLDSGESQGLLFYVMPFWQGESLRDRIGRERQLPIEAVVHITHDVALALDYSHAHGIVHCDIKPDNILLSGESAVVADFGIALALTAAGAGSGISTELMIGTPTYMSPEQADDRASLTPATDIYSLGCVVYEMLVGEPPFTGTSSMALIAKHSLTPPPSIRTLRNTTTLSMERAVQRALAKVPADRFKTASEFARAIADRETADPPIVSTPTGSRREGAARRRRVVLAGTALLAASLLGAYWFSHRHPTSPSIVVLPFDNLGSPADQHIADGLTDELTSRLTGFTELTTISRSSAIRYRGSSTKTIRSDLGVSYILSGSVRSERTTDSSGSVRLIPHLIRTSDDREIWTDRFDAALVPGDMLRLQSRLAEAVATALGVQVLPGHPGSQSKRTSSLEAYEYYLRGNLQDSSPFIADATRRALEMYSTAVAIDPGYADAWAKLAIAHSLYYFATDRTQTRAASAEFALARALALDSSSTDVQLARGHVLYWVRRDYGKAREAFEGVLAREPRNPGALWMSASIARRKGEWQSALEKYELLVAVDPRSPLHQYELASTYGLFHRFDEAEAAFDRAIRFGPTWVWGYVGKSEVALKRSGDRDAAKKPLGKVLGLVDTTQVLATLIPHGVEYIAIMGDVFQKPLFQLSLATSPVDSVEYYLMLGDFHVRARNRARASVYYDSALTVLNGRGGLLLREWTYHSQLGLAYAGLGKRELAIRQGVEAVRLATANDDAGSGAIARYDLASMLADLGDYDGAFKQLEPLLRPPSDLTARYVSVVPRFEPLRSRLLKWRTP